MSETVVSRLRINELRASWKSDLSDSLLHARPVCHTLAKRSACLADRSKPLSGSLNAGEMAGRATDFTTLKQRLPDYTLLCSSSRSRRLDRQSLIMREPRGVFITVVSAFGISHLSKSSPSQTNTYRYVSLSERAGHGTVRNVIRQTLP